MSIADKFKQESTANFSKHQHWGKPFECPFQVFANSNRIQVDSTFILVITCWSLTLIYVLFHCFSLPLIGLKQFSKVKTVIVLISQHGDGCGLGLKIAILFCNTWDNFFFAVVLKMLSI